MTFARSREILHVILDVTLAHRTDVNGRSQFADSDSLMIIRRDAKLKHSETTVPEISMMEISFDDPPLCNHRDAISDVRSL